MNLPRQVNLLNGKATVILCAILLQVLPSAGYAYCLHNDTSLKLFMMVETSDGVHEPKILLRESVSAGQSACCRWQDHNCNPAGLKTSQLNFYVFANEDALEGCDVFSTANSDVHLTRFELFDRCYWR